MRKYAAAAALAAGVLLGGAVTATAATFDFTDSPFLAGPPFQGSVGGIGFTLTFTPAGETLTFNSGADAPGPVNGSIFNLAGDGDGIGIGDDEISDFQLTAESLTITFEREVRLSALAFLDLFLASENHPNPEQAIVNVLLGSGAGTMASFIGNQVVGPAPNFGNGFAEYATNLRGTSFLFTAGIDNDDVGIADFALAAMQVEPIPLPASVLLLGGALGGLGVMRRRRRG